MANKKRDLSALMLLVGLLTMVVLFSGCETKPAAESKQIVVYNSPPEWANWGEMLKKFSAKTGIQATPDNKNSGQTVTALIAEKAKPGADAAYLGITFGYEAANRDLLAGYKPSGFDEIPNDLKDPEGRWMTIHYGAIAFIVNTDALDKTPAPKSWADLLKPEYKGKVAFLDPTSAAVGYSVAVAANLAMGGSLDNWEPGFKYFKRLEAQGVEHPKQTATPRVIKGEIPILIDADFNGYRPRVKENAPLQVVIPAEGSLKMLYVIGMVKGAPRPDAAKKLIDYVLSDEGQKIWAGGFVQPIRAGMVPPEVASQMLPASDYARTKAVDYLKMQQVQKAFTDRWQAEIVAK
jgi:putative spermidine/putrescine transport system substrate-binding protein